MAPTVPVVVTGLAPVVAVAQAHKMTWTQMRTSQKVVVKVPQPVHRVRHFQRHCYFYL